MFSKIIPLQLQQFWQRHEVPLIQAAIYLGFPAALLLAVQGVFYGFLPPVWGMLSLFFLLGTLTQKPLSKFRALAVIFVILWLLVVTGTVMPSALLKPFAAFLRPSPFFRALDLVLLVFFAFLVLPVEMLALGVISVLSPRIESEQATQSRLVYRMKVNRGGADILQIVWYLLWPRILLACLLFLPLLLPFSEELYLLSDSRSFPFFVKPLLFALGSPLNIIVAGFCYFIVFYRLSSIPLKEPGAETVSRPTPSPLSLGPFPFEPVSKEAQTNINESWQTPPPGTLRAPAPPASLKSLAVGLPGLSRALNIYLFLGLFFFVSLASIFKGELLVLSVPFIVLGILFAITQSRWISFIGDLLLELFLALIVFGMIKNLLDHGDFSRSMSGEYLFIILVIAVAFVMRYLGSRRSCQSLEARFGRSPFSISGFFLSLGLAVHLGAFALVTALALATQSALYAPLPSVFYMRGLDQKILVPCTFIFLILGTLGFYRAQGKKARTGLFFILLFVSIVFLIVLSTARSEGLAIALIFILQLLPAIWSWWRQTPATVETRTPSVLEKAKL